MSEALVREDLAAMIDILARLEERGVCIEGLLRELLAALAAMNMRLDVVCGHATRS